MIRANLTGTVFPVMDLVIWLIPTDTDMVSAILDWSAVAGAAEYKIYKSTTSPTSGYTLIDSTTVTQWTDANAAVNHVNSYYYVTVDHVLDSPVTGARRVDPAIGPVAGDHVSSSLISGYRQRKFTHPEINRVTNEDFQIQPRQETDTRSK